MIDSLYEDLKQLEILLKKYPTEESRNTIIFELGKLETFLGNTKKAKQYFELLLDTSYKDKAMQSLIIISTKEQDYESLIKYVVMALELNMKIGSKLLVLLLKELNVFIKDRPYDIRYNYDIYQYIDYDEFLALEHIVLSHTDYTSNPNKSLFREDIDVYRLFNDIKNHLTEENKIQKLEYSDIYIIPYPNVGTLGESYIKVVAIPNTKNILSMYPVFEPDIPFVKRSTAK